MKRFSETEKWKDEWFSSLSILEKLVFLFIIDNCDNAGFFELNKRLNSFLIGIDESKYLEAIEGLNRGLIKSKCGNKYFIKKFLFHQKNLPLNIQNNAHKQILFLIEINKNLFDYDFEKLGANKGLISPIGKGKGKGKGLSIEENKEVLSSDKEIFENLKFELFNSGVWIADCERIYKTNNVKMYLTDFFNEIWLKEDFYKSITEMKKHFVSWLKIQIEKQNKFTPEKLTSTNNPKPFPKEEKTVWKKD